MSVALRSALCHRKCATHLHKRAATAGPSSYQARSRRGLVLTNRSSHMGARRTRPPFKARLFFDQLGARPVAWAAVNPSRLRVKRREQKVLRPSALADRSPRDTESSALAPLSRAFGGVRMRVWKMCSPVPLDKIGGMCILLGVFYNDVFSAKTCFPQSENSAGRGIRKAEIGRLLYRAHLLRALLDARPGRAGQLALVLGELYPTVGTTRLLPRHHRLQLPLGADMSSQ
ncbi:hypothetical protein PSPO01_09182 [Paraphaeosphaeria sporulosa]